LNAKDVTEALRMLKAKNVDIVFLGEETPQKLVKKFYEKVRAMPQHRELPIYTVPIMLKYNYKRADDDGPDYDTGYFVCR
jgi:ABC-type Zn uptake system ZnuABC Zn-binding protein ZnuA